MHVLSFYSVGNIFLIIERLWCSTHGVLPSADLWDVLVMCLSYILLHIYLLFHLLVIRTFYLYELSLVI